MQIEKIVLFLLQQQGHLASRIEDLGEQRAALMEQSDISQICQLREAYREVGYDLVKLLRFLDINATGIRKILKKFDKRFGYKFTDYYVSTRANHPYSQLQQIFKQVVNSHASPSFLSDKDQFFPPMMHWRMQGVVAVVGALSRNLAYLQDNRGSFSSIYDHPSLTIKVSIFFCSNHIDAFPYGLNSNMEHVHLLISYAGPCHRTNKSFSTKTHALHKLPAILRTTRTYRGGGYA